MTHRGSIFTKPEYINLRGKLMPLKRPLVMGILNLTEDSFYDGGRYNHREKWLMRVQQMVEEGMDILDIGAQSSRPGATEKGPEAELEILLPALETITRGFPDLPVSIDTWHARVAREAAAAGAAMINDISGSTFDSDMAATMAGLQLPYILMHTPAHPSVMQQHTDYNDVVKEVIFFLSKQLKKLHRAGVNDIIIDPGFGFGKTLEQNYQLLSNLEHFEFFELPLLVGISRKSMIYRLLETTPDEALAGTVALNMVALQKGADILRVHDIKEAVHTIRVFEALQNSNNL